MIVGLIDELARRFLAEAEGLDAYALRRLTVELARALPGMVDAAERAASDYARLQAAGATLGETERFAVVRARAVAQRVEAEVNRLLAEAAPELVGAQQRAVEHGLKAARGLVEAALPEGVSLDLIKKYGPAWSTPPLDAARTAVAAQSPGTPLRALLDAVGPDVSRSVRTHLVSGLLAGQPPRTVGRAISRDVGLASARAQTIARTETLRSYRMAQQVAWERNKALVPRFRRLAALNRRTCPACLAMDGAEQETGTLMASHPNDRCTVVPILAIPGLAQTPPESGADWFARQDADVQRTVLGMGGYERYQDGVPLARFAGVQEDAAWGPSIRVTPLKEIA